jgi:predicted negative regulator of RcsB-dependent stress response
LTIGLQAEALAKLGDIEGAAAAYNKAVKMDSTLVKKVQRRMKELERQVALGGH